MNSDIKFYWSLLLRRLPFMGAIFVLCAALGLGVAYTLPSRYSANASLLVESPQIPDELAASTVRTPSQEQLEIIEQRLMRRANLIDIAAKYGVFEGASRMRPDEVVRSMRGLTTIRTASGRNRATIMTISFRSRSPQVAANVVNEYTSLILNEDAGRRQELAEQTLDFFEQEVTRLDQELQLVSDRIVDFKNRNQDALPENLGYKLDRQASLQDLVAAASRDITLLSEQRNRLVELGTAAISGQARSPLENEIQSAQDELDSALLVYSETNPRVTVLKSRVAALQARLASQQGVDPDQDPARVILESQLTDITRRQEMLDVEIARAEGELSVLRDAIDRTPGNAIQLEALERDYSNTQAQYNAAVSNMARAEPGKRIEVLSKGERITVIEQAVPPNRPDTPNRPMIAGGGVFVGTALAAAFFLLAELLNRSIRRPAELTSGLGIQPLATIPYLEPAGKRQRRRALNVILIGGLGVGVPIALWWIHTFYLPLDFLIDSVLGRLGS